MLQSKGSQRLDTTERLNLTDMYIYLFSSVHSWEQIPHSVKGQRSAFEFCSTQCSLWDFK